MTTREPRNFCFTARPAPARAQLAEVGLDSHAAHALALLVPLLGCGEEAAALAFDGLAANDADPATAAALGMIADEERVHDGLLQSLAQSLPVVETAAMRRAARRFHIDLGRGSALAHLARIAAIDAGVCTILSRLLRPRAPAARDRTVANMLSRIRSDEIGHVRLSRSIVLSRADGRQFEDVAQSAREALANVLTLAADAFEALEVDPARLRADIRLLPRGLLRA